jgi:hypothetical protein
MQLSATKYGIRVKIERDAMRSTAVAKDVLSLPIGKAGTAIPEINALRILHLQNHELFKQLYPGQSKFMIAAVSGGYLVEAPMLHIMGLNKFSLSYEYKGKAAWKDFRGEFLKPAIEAERKAAWLNARAIHALLNVCPAGKLRSEMLGKASDRLDCHIVGGLLMLDFNDDIYCFEKGGSFKYLGKYDERKPAEARGLLGTAYDRLVEEYISDRMAVCEVELEETIPMGSKSMQSGKTLRAQRRQNRGVEL